MNFMQMWCIYNEKGQSRIKANPSNGNKVRIFFIYLYTGNKAKKD